MTESLDSSTSALHKQWAKLEDEHHELANAIDAARTKKAEVAQMRERQQILMQLVQSSHRKTLTRLPQPSPLLSGPN